MISPGTAVLVHGSAATVTSVHQGGKRYGVTYDDGKQTFVNAAACKPVPPRTIWDLPIAAWAMSEIAANENGGT